MLIAVGVLNLGLAASSGELTSAAVGAMLTILGVLMMTKPPVVLSHDSIEMKNMLGKTVRTYELTNAKVEVRDRKIFVDDKRRVALWYLDTDEQAVRDFFEASS